MMVSFKDIQFARDRISRYIYKTPLDFSMYLSNRYTDVFLKLECQQRLKGFKIRGALSKMTGLTDEEKARGVFPPEITVLVSATLQSFWEVSELKYLCP